MIIIVDTNILFSACLTPQGRIFEILFNIPLHTQLISNQHAIEELLLHKDKLIKLSRHTAREIDIIINSILKQVDIYSEDIIAKTHWLEADKLTKDVDSKDISFVALTLSTGGILWTGDKKLVNHLNTMGFSRTINTSDLHKFLNVG